MTAQYVQLSQYFSASEGLAELAGVPSLDVTCQGQGKVRYGTLCIFYPYPHCNQQLTGRPVPHDVSYDTTFVIGLIQGGKTYETAVNVRSFMDKGG